MGIAGLLPALKSIQVTKQLSEYSGKTIAVDAYVWLHRGIFACATELATGKITNKYVHYTMQRVRLLRHFKIEPYIVFDGGPLPAKKGTEKERKQRRDEHLARGKAFLQQGKHSQARDCFVKCIDVTPQMAFQLIKALRAESVSYVVAPYEADAQLAYLERIGIVDAILTEDSDLLVFGCQNVLFKLNADENTVVSISRKHFGSVTATSMNTNGISLLGWTDVQFRHMAILSGCDYLPSIPGIGLKTASTLLRKWKTAEQVLKAVALEGKKPIPQDYWKSFQLAEKCFLHQRVYCPLAERLVHLTPTTHDWHEDFEAYVGGDLDPVLAQRIARGDVDPSTYMDMKDINPGFIPNAPRKKPLTLISNSPTKSSESKGKKRESFPPAASKARPQPTGGILNFFGPNPIIPPRHPSKKAPIPVPPVTKPNLSGKASGKRTLADVMDQDMDRKKARQSYSPLRATTHSKFFASASGVQRRHSDGVVGPSRLYEQEKENLRVGPLVEDYPEAEEEDQDGSDLSILANFDSRAAERDMDLDPDDFPEVVEQEDGYISPSPSYSKDVQDLSSPPQPGHSRGGNRKQQRWAGEDTQRPGQTGILQTDDEDEDDNSFGADVISSPVSVKRPKIFNRRQPLQSPPRQGAACSRNAVILVGATPTPPKKKNKSSIYPNVDDLPSPTLHNGPDLRSMLKEEHTTELDYQEDFEDDDDNALDTPNISGSASPLSPSPETPNNIAPYAVNPVVINVHDLEDLDEEETRRAKESADRAQMVMEGWRERFALPAKAAGKQIGGVSESASAGRKSVPGAVGTGLAAGSRPMHLRRDETNVTPSGRFSLAKGKAPRSAPPKFTVDSIGGGSGSTIRVGARSAAAVKPRRSLLFQEAIKQTSRPSTSRKDPAAGGVGSTTKGKAKQVVDLTMSDDVEPPDDDIIMVSPRRAKPRSLLSDEQVEILSSAQFSLERFRCVR